MGPAGILAVLQEVAGEAGGAGVLEKLRLLDLASLLRAVIMLFVGIPTMYALSSWVRGWVGRTSTPQRGLILGKLLWYVGLVGILVTALLELGFNLAPLLGAAGILGVALGFASQTSVSNIISGFFLMGEQPFVVGDVIQVGTTIGTVLSIDMMSVKMRTFDNKFVRIPNETIVKSEVTTITRFPIRRLDVAVGVAYKEDAQRVRRALEEVAEANPMALMEPHPVVIFEGYGESALNFSLRVWAARQNWLALKDTIHEEIKDRFDADGIEIPFPHRTLYTGAITEPMPVRLVGPEAPRGDGSPDGVRARTPADPGAREAGGELGPRPPGV